MKNAKLITISLATAALVALTTSAAVQGAAKQTRDARDGQYAGSVDARQHGYEHAYRDGADRGRQDRERRAEYSLRDNDYLAGARTYEKAFGDKAQYMDGYREGYKAGYDDGFNGRDGQYGQLYARPSGGNRAPARNDVYGANPPSATDMAFDAGYREGITLGQQDRGRNARSNIQGSAAYRSGDLGYRSSYGDRNAYRLQFRDGVERGYEDGYGRSQGGGNDAGDRARNTSPNRAGNGGRQSNGSRNGQGGGGTFTVPANRQWTPTGIRVNQGDVLRFTSTGEIRFTGNDDRAGVAGSLAQRLVPGAPLPAAFAGALIGRIDNGLPFAIGNSQSITAPASGLFYLGTNDDNVSDNSGQFQVVISLGR
jgi:hypothetical protein